MRQGRLAALLALAAAAAAACLLPGAAAAGRGLADSQREPLLATTKPWDSKKADYQKPLIGILAQVRRQRLLRLLLRQGGGRQLAHTPCGMVIGPRIACVHWSAKEVLNASDCLSATLCPCTGLPLLPGPLLRGGGLCEVDRGSGSACCAHPVSCSSAQTSFRRLWWWWGSAGTTLSIH